MVKRRLCRLSTRYLNNRPENSSIHEMSSKYSKQFSRPEFILQQYKDPKGRPTPKVIFTKNEYNDKVRVHDWARARESLPKDHDPYPIPGGSHHISTYKRLGHEQEEEMTTTARLMMEQIKQKNLIRKADHRPLISYGSYNNDRFKKLDETLVPREDCSNEYLSTMHASYRVPYPYVMKPLSLPQVPYLQNRKLIWEEPSIAREKFFDQEQQDRIRKLQELKAFRSRSYNPSIQEYSDGTLSDKPKPKCYELNFKHV